MRWTASFRTPCAPSTASMQRRRSLTRQSSFAGTATAYTRCQCLPRPLRAACALHPLALGLDVWSLAKPGALPDALLERLAEPLPKVEHRGG